MTIDPKRWPALALVLLPKNSRNVTRFYDLLDLVKDRYGDDADEYDHAEAELAARDAEIRREADILRTRQIASEHIKDHAAVVRLLAGTDDDVAEPIREYLRQRKRELLVAYEQALAIRNHQPATDAEQAETEKAEDA